jgi:hypothetical protein
VRTAAAPRLSSRAKPGDSRDSAHPATASGEGLVIRVSKTGCHSEAGLIVEEPVSPRLGTTRPTGFVPHRPAPFESRRDWECFDADAGRIPPARFASISSPTSAREEPQPIPGSIPSPYSYLARRNYEMGFAQQCCLVGSVQICVVGDGVQGKGIPSPASAIQKPGGGGFRLLFRADSADHAVRMVADEVFCRLPKNGSRQRRPAVTSLIAKHAMF